MSARRELDLLERAYGAEVEGAIFKRSHIMQTRSKLAPKLVSEGLLREVVGTYGTLTISGYELTDLGRMSYCMSDRCSQGITDD